MESYKELPEYLSIYEREKFLSSCEITLLAEHYSLGTEGKAFDKGFDNFKSMILSTYALCVLNGGDYSKGSFSDFVKARIAVFKPSLNLDDIYPQPTNFEHLQK